MVAIDGWPKHSRYPNVSWKCAICGGKRYTSIIATLTKTEGRACLVLPDWQGHFVRSLGKAGEKDTEQEVLLLEHDVPHQPFSQAVLSFLPKMPWAITPEVVKTTYSTNTYSMFTSRLLACSLASHHCVYLCWYQDLEKREDLRHLTVCSVDPPGCTDIDDALHCRELENGTLEVHSPRLCSLNYLFVSVF